MNPSIQALSEDIVKPWNTRELNDSVEIAVLFVSNMLRSAIVDKLPKSNGESRKKMMKRMSKPSEALANCKNGYDERLDKHTKSYQFTHSGDSFLTTCHRSRTS